MCDIPIEVDDGEKIVRAMMASHVNHAKTKLKPRAFRSRPRCDEVSVIRRTYTGSDFCKAKGRAIASASGMEYVGLVVLLASQIRQAGSEITDSRDEFCGHAHISHGIVVPLNEPLPPQENLELDKKLTALLASALYYRDPNPEANSWTGPEL
jgi:hypothetical protein